MMNLSDSIIELEIHRLEDLIEKVCTSLEDAIKYSKPLNMVQVIDTYYSIESIYLNWQKVNHSERFHCMLVIPMIRLKFLMKESMNLFVYPYNGEA